MSDPLFQRPFIDSDEWRDLPTRHRFVHGGFEETDTRFSFYLPPPESFQGRFLHWLEGGQGGHEDTASSVMSAGMGGSIEFAFSCGAYLVESNQGHLGSDPGPDDPTVVAYRANAAVARYARDLATEMYGSMPHHGYLYGGSGGGMRTIQGMENVNDLWDGAVPFIPGATAFSTAMSSASANATRVLGSQLAGVVDAIEPGGSGDPFAGLSSEQRDALGTLYLSGFPRRGEFQLVPSPVDNGLTARFIGLLMDDDPSYFEEFWTLPGYLGADGALAASISEEKTCVEKVVTLAELQKAGSNTPSMFLAATPETPVGITIGEGVSTERCLLTVTTGQATGRELFCMGAVGDVWLIGTLSGAGLAGVKPGDELLVSNRKYLAFSYYHRYSSEPSRPDHRQFIIDGRSIYPERPTSNPVVSRPRTATTYHRVTPTGRFQGKMICINHALDTAAVPAFAVTYANAVREHLGEGAGGQFRLWFTDNAAHVPGHFLPPGSPPVVGTRLINYGGCIEQAVRDLIDWVEQDKAPPQSSVYEWSEDLRLTLDPSAKMRAGIQPVVVLRADGGVRAETKSGAPVRLEAVVEVPVDAGTIIDVEWDFDGTGTWPVRDSEIDGSSSSLHVSAVHAFESPGTYFPAVRVTSHRRGDLAATDSRVTNIGRARVVVT